MSGRWMNIGRYATLAEGKEVMDGLLLGFHVLRVGEGAPVAVRFDGDIQAEIRGPGESARNSGGAERGS